jgi:hypothetical protein
MLNYKLNTNLTDLGRDFGPNREDETFNKGVKSSVFYPTALDVDNDTTEMLY